MGAAVWKFGLAASSLFLLVAAQSSDICGEISGVLKLPSLKSPFKPVTYGNIGESIYHCSHRVYADKPSQMTVSANPISPAMLEAIQLRAQRWSALEEILFQ